MAPLDAREYILMLIVTQGVDAKNPVPDLKRCQADEKKDEECVAKVLQDRRSPKKGSLPASWKSG